MMFMDNSNLLSGFLIIGLILIIIGLLGAIAFLAGGLVLYDLYKDHAEGGTPQYYYVDTPQQCVEECVDYSENNSDVWSSCPTCY